MKPPSSELNHDGAPPPPPDQSAVTLRDVEPHEVIKHMIDSSDQAFEDRVLACALNRSDFLALVRPVLCVNPQPERQKEDDWQDDFAEWECAALFRCIRKHFEATLGNGSRMTREFLRSALEQGVSRVQEISEDEIPSTLERFDAIDALDLPESWSMVEQGFIYWLEKTRTTRFITSNTASDGWSPARLTEGLQAQLEPVRNLAQPPEGRFQAFGEAPPPEPTEIIKSGLRACDESIGGFAKEELTLVIAPSGGGKTVLATQFAGAFARKEYKVLFITTEQPPHELTPRIVSNQCNIPFSRIKGGVNEQELQPDEHKRYRQLFEILSANLHFANWGKDRSRSISNDLDGEVREFVKLHGRLDVVIFDYIGGALGEIHGHDQHALRMAMLRTGDALADLSRKHKLVVIACAQAGITSSRGKRRIGQEDIAECKGLGRAATNVIGLSALLDTSDEDGSSYASTQYLNVSKARKSAGGCRRLVRDFGFQRYRDV